MSSPSPSPASGASSLAPSPGRFRWSICGLLFFSVALNYIDRNIIGILKAPLSRELGWSETDYAHIASAFQFAYAFGYLLGGRFMDWIGVKRGLPLAVLCWSIAAAAHGLCGLLPHNETATLSLEWLSLGALTVPLSVLGFMSARIALGLAEGGNFPGAIKTVAEWFPLKERALATGIFNAGTNVGAILCPFAVPRMYAAWGWPATFYITGALGLVWLVGWRWLYENPDTHPRLSAAERNYIRSGAEGTALGSSPLPKDAHGAALAPPLQKERRPAPVPWLSLFRYRAVWAYLAAGILAGPVWNIYMFFLPDFLQKRFHLDLVGVGDWTAVFYVIASFGGVTGGWLSGRLLGRGWTLNAARKVSLLCCALAVVPIFLAPSMPNVLLTVLIVGLAGSAHQGWSANLFSFVSDTMPKRAISSVVGLGGFVAYFTGGVMTEIIGKILQKTGSYASIFAAASLLYLLSLLIVHVLVPRIDARQAAS